LVIYQKTSITFARIPTSVGGLDVRFSGWADEPNPSSEKAQNPFSFSRGLEEIKGFTKVKNSGIIR